jgi:O-antigen/teichoic acid export membrane protein
MTSFVKNIVKLSSGSVIAQAIAVLTMPVITRYFTPEAFGTLGIFVAVIGMTGVISSFRYELAIMLPKDDKDASNILVFSLFLTICSSIFLFAIIYLFKLSLFNQFDLEKYNNFLYFIPMMTCIMGFYKSLSRWHGRHQRFGSVANSMVMEKLFSQSLMIGAGFFGFTSGLFLILSRITGQFASFLFLFVLSFLKEKTRIIKNFSFSRSFGLLKRYENFPKYDLWSALFNSGSQNLPVILLGLYFSSEVVGYFALGRQVLNIPMVFIGNAVGQVFFQKASQSLHDGTLSKTVESVFESLVKYGLLPFLILMVSGEELFSFVFGSQWGDAGVYAQYLSLWVFFVFISSPLSTLLIVLEKQKVFMVWNFGLFITRSLIIVAGGFIGSDKITIFLFGIVGVAGYLVMNLMILKYSGISVKKGVFIFSKVFLKCLPFLIATYIISLFNFAGIKLLFSIICIVSVYYIITLLNDKFLFQKNKR